MLPAPYPSLILGPGIFLASFLLPWSPQKQVLQPPAQLSQPHCWGSTPSSKGMLSSLRAGHRAGVLPRSISPAALALWHLLLYLSPPKCGGPLLPAAWRWSREGLSYHCCRVPAGWCWQAPQGWERLPLGTEHAETTSLLCPSLKTRSRFLLWAHSFQVPRDLWKVVKAAITVFSNSKMFLFKYLCYVLDVAY